MRMTATFRASRRSPLLQVLKSAVATVAAWLLAGWLLPGPLPVFAAIAALLVVQPSLNQSFSKAIERTVGVIVGVAVASVLGLLLGNGTWIILLAILIALVLAWSLRMTAGTANQVAISAMLVLALGTGTQGYAVDRIIETMLGAVIGFVVNIALVPPVAVVPAHRAVDRLGAELAATLDRLAWALVRPQSPADLTELIVTARLLRPMRGCRGHRHPGRGRIAHPEPARRTPSGRADRAGAAAGPLLHRGDPDDRDDPHGLRPVRRQPARRADGGGDRRAAAPGGARCAAARAPTRGRERGRPRWTRRSPP